MSVGNTFILTRWVAPDVWSVFIEEKPACLEISTVDANQCVENVAEQLETARTIITVNSGRLTPTHVQKAKQLKLIQTVGQGLDHLPVKWALENGVYVANAGGENAVAVAESTVLLMLACLKRFVLLNQSIRDGKYQGDAGKGTNELYDKTVGIIGFGNIGRRVAQLCYGFGARIVYFSRRHLTQSFTAGVKAKLVSLDDLLLMSDIVSLHVPSDDATRGMIG